MNRSIVFSRALFVACGLLGCSETEQEMACTAGERVVPSGTLTNAEDCGTWEVTVDEHVYINVTITEADMACAGETLGAVTLPHTPIYSNASAEAPKWTFDIYATSTGSGELAVICDEGTTFDAFFEVVE